MRQRPLHFIFHKTNENFLLAANSRQFPKPTGMLFRILQVHPVPLAQASPPSWSSAPTLLPIPKPSLGHSNSPPGDINNPLWKQSVHQAKCDQPDGLTSVWLGSSETHHAALLISAQSAQISEFLTPLSSDAREGHSLLCTSPFRTTKTLLRLECTHSPHS